MLDLAYNMLLALASGFYEYEKLLERLKQKELNYAELVRLLVKMPVFSNNLVGLGAGFITQAFATGLNRDGMFSSVGEAALAYEIKNILKAMKSWGHYFFGEVPDQHPIIPTYNAFGRVIPGLGSTLTRMAIMQAYGDTNTTGRSSRNRSSSSWVMDQIDINNGVSEIEQMTRDILKDSDYRLRENTDVLGNYPSRYKPKLFNPKTKELNIPTKPDKTVMPKPAVPPSTPAPPPPQQPIATTQESSGWEVAIQPEKAPPGL
jgi:hypothetical protein